MATINNTDLIKEITDGAKISVAREGVPSQMQNVVIPVMEVNPKLLRTTSKHFTATSSTTAVAQALISGAAAETYITGVHISWARDATCDNVLIQGDITSDFGQMIFYKVVPLTTTARAESIYIQFKDPIYLKKGITASANLAGTFTAGAMNKTITLVGYQVQNINA